MGKVVSTRRQVLPPGAAGSSTVVKLTPLAVPRAVETKTFQAVVHARSSRRGRLLRNGLLGAIRASKTAGVCRPRASTGAARDAAKGGLSTCSPVQSTAAPARG